MMAPETRDWRVGVVVPAHDEEALVGRCLDSVLSALDHAGREGVVALVADTCRDRTETIARARLADRGVVARAAARSPGAARRLGARVVLDRLAHVQPSAVWLMSTDADTQVPTDWISIHLAHAARGAVAVAGILEVDDLDPAARRVFRETYTLRSGDTHDHAHGANLGVRADAYCVVGGFRPLATSEDRCLWRRLRRYGPRAVAALDSVVRTSGRTTGRARGGLADDLRACMRGSHGAR